jgi:hypothetical protein
MKRRGSTSDEIGFGGLGMRQRFGFWLASLCAGIVTALIVVGWVLQPSAAAQAQESDRTDTTQAQAPAQTSTVQAQAPVQTNTVQAQGTAPTSTLQPQFRPSPNTTCLLCHLDATESYTLPSGESFGVDVDPAVLDASVHISAKTANNVMRLWNCTIPAISWPRARQGCPIVSTVTAGTM